MIKIAPRLNLNAIFMAAVCVGMFLLGVETSEGTPEGSLFLLPLCLAWLGRDPRAMKLAIVGALLLLVLIWAQAGFSLDRANLLQWCTSAFLVVFLGGCLIEAQHALRRAERAGGTAQAAGQQARPMAKAGAAPKRRLPKNRSLSAATLQGLIDSIRGAAFLFDREMRLILANGKAEEMIAFARPGAEVAHAAEFLPESALDLLYDGAEGKNLRRDKTASLVGKPYRFRLEPVGRDLLLTAEETPGPEAAPERPGLASAKPNAA